MSGDVQPRKRKDKSKKRKEDDDPVPIREKRSSSEHSPDIQMHIEKESETGGHWCAKIVFFALLSILIGLVALIIIENRGMTEVAQPQGESRFSEYFEGWVEEPKDHDEEEHHVVGDLHDEDEGDDDHDVDHHDDTGAAYEEENLSQQEDDDDDVPPVSEETPVDDEPEQEVASTEEPDEEVANSQELPVVADDDDNDEDEEDQNTSQQVPVSAENDDQNNNDDDEEDENVSAPPEINLDDGDLPFEEDATPDSTEQFFDNDAGEELYIKRMSEEKLAKSKEATKSVEADETPEKSSVAVKIVVGITMLIVGVQVLVNRKPAPSSSPELYESREKISDPEIRTNIAQLQAFKTENIERYIAEQVPVGNDEDILLEDRVMYQEEEVEEEMLPEKVPVDTYVDEDEVEVEEFVPPPIQSRFHDFQAPPKPVPTIIETPKMIETPSEPETTMQDPPSEDLPPPAPLTKHPVMDLLDPIERDPGILSDSSDIAYETLEVEFIDDDADWEDDEFDDDPDEIYSGEEESPDPDDIESPGSHDDEEEDPVSDVDDTELMARLEAKYGKLNI